jgi:DNA-binding response OmpR family regulator
VLDRDPRFVRRISLVMRSAGWKVAELSVLPDRGTMAAMRPNVLLVDLAVVQTDARWLARQVADAPDLAIVACTERSSVAQRVRSLHEGLDGWIAKPCDPSELQARVQAIVRARQSSITPVRETIHGGDIDVSPDRYDAIAGGQSAGLTTREFEVLELLAHNGGQAVERELIYSGVWGDDVPSGDRSVDIFVGRIRLKLKRISPGWRYLHTHPGVGYRFSAERISGAATPPAPQADDESMAGAAKDDQPAHARQASACA